MTQQPYIDYIPTRNLDMDKTYDVSMFSPLHNLAGKRFGRLTVSTQFQRRRINRYATGIVWLCTCDCGRKAWVGGYSLQHGLTTSCGCYHAERTREALKRRRAGL